MESLQLLKESGIPFLVGGTLALSIHAGVPLPQKDVDVFCTAGDYRRILAHFGRHGFDTEVEDERWIAKVKRDGRFLDLIFNSTIAIVPVTSEWFAHAVNRDMNGLALPLLSPTELIWSKAFVQDRYRYDGADIAHLILRQCENVDWRRLLSYMEPYWEVLLAHIVNFRFIYPTERERIPQWLLGELISRLELSTQSPIGKTNICRGRLFSRGDYLIDISEWGFADLIGEGKKSTSTG